jgi:hypothetical protein
VGDRKANSKVKVEMRNTMNWWGISALLINALLIISNFFVIYPQWVFTIFLIVFLFIPEWGNTASQLNADDVPLLKIESSTIGRFITHFFCLVLIINRFTNGALKPRYNLYGMNAFLNVIILFVCAYVLPMMLWKFFIRLLFEKK